MDSRAKKIMELILNIIVIVLFIATIYVIYKYVNPEIHNHYNIIINERTIDDKVPLKHYIMRGGIKYNNDESKSDNIATKPEVKSDNITTKSEYKPESKPEHKPEFKSNNDTITNSEPKSDNVATKPEFKSNNDTITNSEPKLDNVATKSEHKSDNITIKSEYKPDNVVTKLDNDVTNPDINITTKTEPKSNNIIEFTVEKLFDELDFNE